MPPLRWSMNMELLDDRYIRQPILDSSPDAGSNTLFGLKKGDVYNAMEKGRADFDKPPFDSMTPKQFVQCYCWFMFRHHFYANYANFIENLGAIENYLKKSDEVVLIDGGCGPATAAFAFSEATKNIAFSYFGIDSSKAMRQHARQLFDYGLAKRVINKKSAHKISGGWGQVPNSFGSKTLVIFSFSFFFASESLEVEVDPENWTTGLDKISSLTCGHFRR